MAHITFIAHGRKTDIQAESGETLLSAAQRCGVELDAPCSGGGICGKCRIRLLSGELDSPRTRHLSDTEYAQGWRLACESRALSDAAVEIPDGAGAYRDRMKAADLSSAGEFALFNDARQRLETAGFAFDSGLRVLCVRVDPPTAEDSMPDNERLARALMALTGASRVTYTCRALKRLARTLRTSEFDVRCVVRHSEDDARVLDVLPSGDASPVAGLAVDLGTTSVAALLVDLQDGSVLAGGSIGNGQIRYGADVIGRLIESGREGGEERLRQAVVEETLLPLMRALCKAAGVAPEDVYRASLAGNTAMNHLLLGLYADPVRTEPYVPSFFHCDDLPARDVGLSLHPDAELILAPNVGSYVGGDITAGCFASLLWNDDALSLLVDLGTNGELVLGNREFLICCACSAGPAFEGGDISCGMRATDGAIDSMRIDSETWVPSYTLIGNAEQPAGLCGSGLIDCVAELFRHGVIDARGRFRQAHERVRFDEHGMGSYIIAFREDTGAPRDIALTEADIDSFIRAKAAIFSATMTMLAAVGMSPDMLDHVYVAGGIGSGIDMDNAVAVGMLPDIDRSRFRYAGNTALTGAWAMLSSRQCRERVDALACEMAYLELSREPGYMDAFVAACFLPHTDAALFPSANRA